MKRLLLVGLAVTVPVAALAGPETDGENSARQIERLLACRNQTNSALRLSCFDREALAVDHAIASHNLVVIDKEKVRQTKRSLFGFSIPSFGGIFGGNEDEVKQIEGIVKSARLGPEGGWMVVLADGSTWLQTDGSTIVLDPRKGDKITIRRAALGSFTMSVGGQPGVKVRRIS